MVDVLCLRNLGVLGHLVDLADQRDVRRIADRERESERETKTERDERETRERETQPFSSVLHHLRVLRCVSTYIHSYTHTHIYI